jgi:uncharacterized protein YgiM (DUF1202 family)
MFISTFIYVSTSNAEWVDKGHGCYTVAIETGQLRVRECAGAECNVIGGLYNGEPICPTKKTGDWAEFEYKSSIGYVSTSFLQACPKKTGSRKTIEAVVLGTECGDYCYATFRLADGNEITLTGDVDDLKEGAKVSATYQNEQWWDAFNGCFQANVLQSVKVLPKK